MTFKSIHSENTLTEMARNSVGDGLTPNVFFVSNDKEVVTATRNFRLAYHQWKALSLGARKETALEDRLFGTIACVEPTGSGSSKLITIDDSEMFLEMYPQPI